MKRVILGSLVGYAVWTAIWLGGNLLIGAAFPAQRDAFGRGEALSSVPYLLLALALSLLCSLAAAWPCARLAREHAGPAVILLAVLLLATGIAVQASAWALMPLWYHLSFLILLVPACVLGGRLATRPEPAT